MTATSRQQNIVAFAKLAILILALDAEPRPARNKQHPFVALLIVPIALGRRLAGRDDALDANALTLEPCAR